MKKFNVTVIRTGYAHKLFTVEANSVWEAENKAYGIAGDYEFNESDADYSIEDVLEVVNTTKQYKVVEAIYPVANEIYTPSYDLINLDNPTDRTIVAPGDFELGDLIGEDEFTREARVYSDENGNEFHAVFAIRKMRNNNKK